MTAAQVIVAVGIVAALAAAVWSARVAYRAPVGEPTGARLRSFDLFDDELRAVPEPPVVSAFGGFLLLILLMYVLLDRGFAWLHLPGSTIFIGEITIAFGLFAMLSSNIRVFRAVRESPALGILLVYMGWGLALLLVGLPTWGIDAVRDSAIWYYGMTAVFAVFLLLSDPTRLRRWSDVFARAIPLILVWFIIAIGLTTVVPSDAFLVPDSTVSILDRKPGNIAVFAAVIIAFLWMVDSIGGRFNARQRGVLTGLAFLAILANGAMNRGGLLAAAAALTLMLFLMRHRRSQIVLIVAGIVVTGAALLLVSGIRIPLANGREISAEQFSQNITSIIDPDAGGERQTDTTEWRLALWTKVLDDVTTDSPLTGFGPGPNLGERYEVIGMDPDNPLRNPHNSHLGVLARLGFVGVMLWVAIWAVWVLRLLDHRAWLRRGGGSEKEHGLAGWALVSVTAILLNAIFDPTLEGPQVAMLLWFVFGIGAMLPILHGPVAASRLATRRQPVTVTISH